MAAQNKRTSQARLKKAGQKAKKGEKVLRIWLMKE